MLVQLALALLLASNPDASAGLTGGERDPFSGPDQARDEAPCDGDGLACVSWQRLKCTSIVTSPSVSVITLQAATGESYFAKVGDRVRNAVIVAIDPDRKGILLREPMPGTVAGFREIILPTGADRPIVREPASAEPVLKVPAQK
jgi:hypothetical protein